MLIDGMSISEWSRKYFEENHISYAIDMHNGTYAEFDGYGHHAECSKHHFDRLGKKMRNLTLF